MAARFAAPNSAVTPRAACPNAELSTRANHPYGTRINWGVRRNARHPKSSRTRHTFVAIAQLCSVLLFLYAIRMGVEFDGDRFAMIFESCAAGLMGLLGWLNWGYATKDRRLVHEWVEKTDVDRVTLRLLPQPITALLTVPCAFFGPAIWGLSWFVIAPLVARATRIRLAS